MSFNYYCATPCSGMDEGRPFGKGLQSNFPNHLMLRLSKERGGERFRKKAIETIGQVRTKKLSESEPFGEASKF